jgi:hypothetical protein
MLSMSYQTITVTPSFHTQALPLIFIRTWGARRSRARDAQVLRNLPQSRTRKPSVHDRGLAAHKARMRIGHFREQSAVAFSPQPQPRQWTVREQAVATALDNPRTDRLHGFSVTTIRPRPRIVRASRLADECPRSRSAFPSRRPHTV